MPIPSHSLSSRLSAAAALAALGTLLAGPACASTGDGVTLSGLIDAYVGAVQASGSPRLKAVNSGGLSTSWWGLEGREALGAGLRAEFKLGAYLRNDSGAAGRFNGNESFFSRNAYIGLAGDFGSLRLGRDGAPNFLPTALFNAFGDSFAFSPLVLHANVPLYNGTGWESVNAADTGWSNQIRYTTPTLDGLSGNLHYQFAEGAASGGNQGASLLYKSERWGLGGFVHRVRVDNPLPGVPGKLKLGFAQQQAWMISARASLGPLQLYANHQQARNSQLQAQAGEARARTWSLSADYAWGPSHKLMAAWARTRWTGSSGVPLAGSQRETLSLGYDHSLSPRSDLYLVLMDDKITARSRGQSYALGLRHRF